MNEKQQLIAMLVRAGIGHGLRHDYREGQPVEVAVQIECEQDTGFGVAEFVFDRDGRLLSIHSYEGEEG